VEKGGLQARRGPLGLRSGGRIECRDRNTKFTETRPVKPKHQQEKLYEQAPDLFLCKRELVTSCLLREGATYLIASPSLPPSRPSASEFDHRASNPPHTSRTPPPRHRGKRSAEPRASWQLFGTLFRRSSFSVIASHKEAEQSAAESNSNTAAVWLPFPVCGTLTSIGTCRRPRASR